jgi:4-aminobutyrate aminotransferase-like enzyme
MKYQLRNLAKKLQKKFPSMISDVRGWGLIIGIEISPESGFVAADVSIIFIHLYLVV